ncbi:MAG: translation initiation factor IF-2, partial [Lentisphaeria bacterium]|nr:translation initiation factor IF-2 [Lentisphaeria bacterium]
GGGGVEAGELHLKAPITVRDLAIGLGAKPNQLIGELMTMNVFAAINQVLEVELVERVCERHGVKFVRERRAKAKAKAKEQRRSKDAKDKRAGKAVSRAPVVAFLGHVDHGKTSLQDYIRKTKVADGEAGGITQHIGASVVETEAGRQLTLLDTPGHEAFTSMRARGANATDIAVLVVAADDGVMPQTIEAINHTKAADVTIVVAMNKMDLPGANPDKVMLGLQQNGIMPEAWGGDVGLCPVSAITGEGIDDLLERIVLESEMLELSAFPEGECEALVIEAQLESAMGTTASALVRNGTLHVGDVMLCGKYWGRVKALIDSTGKRVKSAGPSTPVKVLGLNGVPEAGDILTICLNERVAKARAQEAITEFRATELGSSRGTTLEDLFLKMEEESRLELKLVLKADVHGSLEAITESLEKIESEKISAKVIHGAVGEVTENDVSLAAASGATIIGFNIRAMPGVNKMAKQRGVEIRLYGVIYELLEQIEDAMIGKLEPDQRETPIGEAEIIQVISTSKVGRICGCRVNGGVIRVGASARVKREDEVIYNGLIASLRRFKDDVREVRSGLECGIGLQNFEEFEEGDMIEAFEITEIRPEL